MNRSISRWLIVGVVAFTLLLQLGCAGGRTMMRTEEGYVPTHVAVGEVIPNTYGDTRMSTDAVIRMVQANLENAMNEQGVSYISLREFETTPVPPEETVMLVTTVSFQSGTRGQGEDCMITYELRRRTDDLIWARGSVRGTDWLISSGAATDLRSAIQNASKATVRVVKELMEGE